MDCPRFRHTRINEEQNELGIEKLVEIIQDNQVGTVVIGLPKNMNNSIGFRGEASLQYKEKLRSLTIHRNNYVG